MISKVLYLIQSGLRYIQLHPHFLFIIGLLVIMPLLFLYVGSQFLEAGRANQDRLQKDRVGMLHDVLESQLSSNNVSILDIQQSISTIAQKNPDITKFKIARKTEDLIVPIAALNQDAIGVPENEAEAELYERGFSAKESLIFEFYNSSSERVWQVLRAFKNSDNDSVYIFTELSLKNVDVAFARQERNAYVNLVFVYAFLLALAYWLHQINDFRYLYLEAEKKLALKDKFTNVMAHELRAPLTAMRGYASLIAESPEATITHQEHANKIQKSTERLTLLINDILEVARIQSGQLSVQITEVDIVHKVKEVVEELRPQAKKNNLSLLLGEVPKSIQIETDTKRLHQILVNIISNAVKYTEKGSVGVELTSHHNTVEIRIRDTGVGIHAEDQKKLFAPFFRVQNQSTEAITGTGLGMWITKQLIELLGGSIGVESMKGVGTTIVITLPKKHLTKL